LTTVLGDQEVLVVQERDDALHDLEETEQDHHHPTEDHPPGPGALWLLRRYRPSIGRALLGAL
jgi:hypothetical protein